MVTYYIDQTNDKAVIKQRDKPASYLITALQNSSRVSRSIIG